MKTGPCGQTDGQTDMAEVIVIFRSFAKPRRIW
jgi:hypothetical protein